MPRSFSFASVSCRISCSRKIFLPAVSLSFRSQPITPYKVQNVIPLNLYAWMAAAGSDFPQS
jgi:hypothetical protein